MWNWTPPNSESCQCFAAIGGQSKLQSVPRRFMASCLPHCPRMPQVLKCLNNPSPFSSEKWRNKTWINPKFSFTLLFMKQKRPWFFPSPSPGILQVVGPVHLLCRCLHGMRPLMDPYRNRKKQQTETSFLGMTRGNVIWQANKSMNCLLNMWIA